MLPSRFGEKIVMRLLDSSATELGLDLLITDSQALAEVRDMGSKPYGILLVTGPTGSGKSTTLYSLLAERNDPGLNISTVEDPIEYTLAGITQTQVNREKGWTSPRPCGPLCAKTPMCCWWGKRAISKRPKPRWKRRSPATWCSPPCIATTRPVLWLGEEMGVETYLLSASLIGVLSQRLLRKLCTHCRQPYQPKEATLARFGLEASQNSAISCYQPPANNTCSHCHGLGYKGRIGVYEVMRVNEVMAEAIGQGAGTDQLRHLALSNGMKTLLGYGSARAKATPAWKRWNGCSARA